MAHSGIARRRTRRAIRKPEFGQPSPKLLYYDGLGVVLAKEKPSGGSWQTKNVYALKAAALGHIISERTMTAWNAQGTPTAWTDKWFHYDLLGNVTLETDSNANVTARVDMEAFGTVLSGGQAGFRLTTKPYDSAAGLYCFQARFYSPETALFLQRAPTVVFDEPPYSYCWQAPTTYVDPNGRLPVLAIVKWANLAIQCGLAAYEAYLFADCMDHCIKGYQEIINNPRVPIEQKPTDITGLCLGECGWIAQNAGTGILCCITSMFIKVGSPTSGNRIPPGPPPTDRGL